ncbi:MAG: hypothetical protein KatS3mg087_0146 [Patescibacteria group bacterium]|nr:MAG: hypothetical protein KatS3mg087_0146 [Patescibacteria group bacterium]
MISCKKGSRENAELKETNEAVQKAVNVELQRVFWPVLLGNTLPLLFALNVSNVPRGEGYQFITNPVPFALLGSGGGALYGALASKKRTLGALRGALLGSILGAIIGPTIANFRR